VSNWGLRNFEKPLRLRYDAVRIDAIDHISTGIVLTFAKQREVAMPFPTTVSDIAQLPDWARDFYIQDGAQWKLNVQTVPLGEDVSGLKSALEKERQSRRDAERLANELRAQYDGIDPKEVKTMAERLEAIKDKHLYDDKGLDAVIADRTGTYRTRIADLEREVQAKQGAYEQLQTGMKRQRIETILRQQIAEAGVAPYAVPDALHRLGNVFNDLDGDVPIARKETGDILYGSDAVRPYSPVEHLTKLKADAPHLWPLSNGAGGGTPGASASTYRITLQDARDNSKWQAAQSAAQRAGVPLEVVPT